MIHTAAGKNNITIPFQAAAEYLMDDHCDFSIS
jgi:hypothetical protein